MNTVPNRYLRALIAVFLITGVASATFFVSNKLSSPKNVAPNAPESSPLASEKIDRIPDLDLPSTSPSPSQPPSYGASIHYNNPTPTATPTPTQGSTPTPSKEPTPKPDSFGAQSSSEDPNSYKSKANNSCKDNLGFVSGTGCRTDGTRFVLNIPETQQAYQEHVNKVKDKILNTTDTELIEIANTDKTSGCKDNDNLCKIEFAEKILLAQNLIINQNDKTGLIGQRSQNQAIQDAVTLSDSEFKSKYNGKDKNTVLEEKKVVDSENIAFAGNLLSAYNDPTVTIGELLNIACSKSGRNDVCLNDLKYMTREQILRSQIGNSISQSYIDQTISQQKNSEKNNKYISLYLDPKKTDKEKIAEYCKDINPNNTEYCINSTKIDYLANYANENVELALQQKKDQDNYKKITDPKSYLTNDAKTALISQIKDESIRNQANDLVLAGIYSDIKNTPTNLAAIYCKGNRSCEENFTPDRFLSQISSPDIKLSATNQRYTSLSILIPNVISGAKLPDGVTNETKREIIKLNEDTTHAFWVYVAEQQNRLDKQIVNMEQLALEFDNIVKKNPTTLLDNTKKYYLDPKSYNRPSATLKYSQEENPLIVAQYNQIIKTQPIKGLFENNKLLNWENIDDTYKEEARKMVCESDKTLSYYCGDYYGSGANTPNRTKAIAQIDAVINDKKTNYLQQFYESKKPNIFFSVNQSNLATIDNPALGDPTLQAEIKKAIAAVDRKDSLSFFDPKSGFGNMAGTSISVPTSARETLPIASKLTEKEKIDLANEYLRRQLVVETHTRGAGVGGALVTAGLSTAACASAGPVGIVTSIGCGALGGFAAVVSNIIPILGTATAEEIEAERQFWVQKTGSEQAGTFIQAMYSNQGASSDESLWGGRSQSTLNNQYALLDRIHETNSQTNATTYSLTDPNYQAQIALQPFLLDQGERLQEENKQQQVLNIAAAPLVGALSGGVGGSLANKTLTQLAKPLTTVLKSTGSEIALWAGGAVINDLQTQIQFNATVDFTDTQSEINLELCNRSSTQNSIECQKLANLVQTENQEAKNTARQQAIITDAIIQAGQTATSFSTSLYNLVQAKYTATQPSTKPSTKLPINPQNDSTYISVGLAELLNTYDPNILNPAYHNIDTITLQNFIKSKINSPTLPEDVANFIRSNPKVTDESIFQAVVIFRDLNEADFITKLNTLGFDETSIEVATHIRNNEPDATNTITDYLNILTREEVDEQTIIEYKDRAAKAIVKKARAQVEVKKTDQLIATLIDSKNEALKGYLHEASSPIRSAPMTQGEITSHLKNLGYSPEDIQFVLDRATLPETAQAVENLKLFNKANSEVVPEIATNLRAEQLNNLAKSIPDPTKPDSATPLAPTPAVIQTTDQYGSTAVKEYINANFQYPKVDFLKLKKTINKNKPAKNNPPKVKVIEVITNIFGDGQTKVKPQINPIHQDISTAVNDYIKANFQTPKTTIGQIQKAVSQYRQNMQDRFNQFRNKLTIKLQNEPPKPTSEPLNEPDASPPVLTITPELIVQPLPPTPASPKSLEALETAITIKNNKYTKQQLENHLSSFGHTTEEINFAIGQLDSPEVKKILAQLETFDQQEQLNYDNNQQQFTGPDGKITNEISDFITKSDEKRSALIKKLVQELNLTTDQINNQ